MKRSIIRVMAIAALLFIAGSQLADVGAAPGPRIRFSQSVSKDVGFCSPIAVPCLVLEPQGSGFPPSSAVTYTLTLCDNAGVCVPTTSQEFANPSGVWTLRFLRPCGDYRTATISTTDGTTSRTVMTRC